MVDWSKVDDPTLKTQTESMITDMLNEDLTKRPDAVRLYSKYSDSVFSSRYLDIEEISKAINQEVFEVSKRYGFPLHKSSGGTLELRLTGSVPLPTTLASPPMQGLARRLSLSKEGEHQKLPFDDVITSLERTERDGPHQMLPALELIQEVSAEGDSALSPSESEDMKVGLCCGDCCLDERGTGWWPSSS